MTGTGNNAQKRCLQHKQQKNHTGKTPVRPMGKTSMLRNGVVHATGMLLYMAMIFGVSVVQAGETTSTVGSATRPAKTFVIILDFACKDNNFGAQISDSVRLRLARHGEYDVIDGLSTKDVSKPTPADAPRDKVIALMERMAVTLAVYGTVEKSGEAFKATIRCLDMSNPAKPLEQEKVFTESGERARGEIARMIVQTVTGADEWVPPQYGDETEPKNFGKPLNKNGDFENGDAGWDRQDNVSTFIEKGPAGRGNILRVQTDLARDPWLEYTRNIRLGLADPARPPKIAHDTGYGSVAGLEGVHYRSEWIKVDGPLLRYWLTADHKGRGGAKVFVKGYRDMSGEADGLPEVSMVEQKLTPESFAKMPPNDRAKLIAADAKLHPDRYRRECYRWYLNCGEAKDKWQHFAAPFPPRGGLPKNVEWLQIQIYSYWPPGEYLWDNVYLFKDPVKPGPQTEEPARTPNFGKTATSRASE